LINQELEGVEVKQPAIYIVSPTATPAEKVANQGNNGNGNTDCGVFKWGVQN
jgi:hypothetical protein